MYQCLAKVKPSTEPVMSTAEPNLIKSIYTSCHRRAAAELNCLIWIVPATTQHMNWALYFIVSFTTTNSVALLYYAVGDCCDI